MDFGEHIVRSIGQIFADPEKDIHKAEIDSAEGQIILPESAFDSKQLGCLTKQMQEVFGANQWSGSLAEKKSKAGCTIFQEKWLCKTKDGIEFEMSVKKEKCKKGRILIEVPGGDTKKRSEITIQVFDWLPDAVKQKC